LEIYSGWWWNRRWQILIIFLCHLLDSIKVKTRIRFPDLTNKFRILVIFFSVLFSFYKLRNLRLEKSTKEETSNLVVLPFGQAVTNNNKDISCLAVGKREIIRILFPPKSKKEL